jgi:hypothetical protein
MSLTDPWGHAIVDIRSQLHIDLMVDGIAYNKQSTGYVASSA